MHATQSDGPHSQVIVAQISRLSARQNKPDIVNGKGFPICVKWWSKYCLIKACNTCTRQLCSKFENVQLNDNDAVIITEYQQKRLHLRVLRCRCVLRPYISKFLVFLFFSANFFYHMAGSSRLKTGTSVGVGADVAGVKGTWQNLEDPSGETVVERSEGTNLSVPYMVIWLF
jgi:hypothetical protein